MRQSTIDVNVARHQYQQNDGALAAGHALEAGPNSTEYSIQPERQSINGTWGKTCQ
jgi:hypothetical protein